MQNRLFVRLIELNMIMILVDILGWRFNTLPGTLNFVLNAGFNLLLYILAPLAPIIWILYVFAQMNLKKNTHRTAKLILFVLFGINLILSVTSLKTGWFFRIDPDNTYHRGSLFPVHSFYSYAMILYTILVILKNRKYFEKQYVRFLFFYFIPPSIGMLLQFFFYGVSFNWTGMMISVLIIFINIQDRRINTDYLTGAYNRRQLVRYIKDKIDCSTPLKSFSAIMIDLNRFKQINDRYGHRAGDQALKAAADILRKSLRKDDFVARIGGDEFIAILSISELSLLERAVTRIRENLSQYNRTAAVPFQLSFAIGYAVYPPLSTLSPEEFLKSVDTLMYQNKAKLSE